ncbi:MAG: ABC transporter substrate-binding protein, partial [Thermicanus sp.]|nr:ABC transporter substrate-binding protein [Thermicanus sp.]
MNQSIFRKLSLFLLILSLIMMGTIGCSTDQGKPEQSASSQLADQQTPPPIEKNQTKENAFPVTVKDGTGKEITVEKAPERIISLIPSNTEIIYALGYGDKIIGVTSNDNYPEEVKTKEKVGDMNVDLEKVVSLNPDLVLANQWHVSGQVDQVAKMREAGLNVLVVNDATSLNQVYESIRLLAKVTDTSDKGEEVIKSMQDRY